MARQQPAEIDPDGVAMIVDAIMTEGYVLKDFSPITDEETEAVYAQAFNLVNQRQYERAEKLFEMLCQLDHFEAKFWMGLGICRQQKKNFEQAVKAYAMVGMLDQENPMPALRAAECYMALQQWEPAESGLIATLHWAGARPQYQEARARASALLEILERRKESGDG
jgi:type III secretion system low calcium response chaperone LcrH/SycD